MRERTVSTNGVELHVTEAGDPGAPPVILCHGFPELGYSWRHQLPVLADAGYHVVAPDQRGYGRSSAPEAIEDYDIVHLHDDLLGLLDDLGHEKAVFVGHDWGAMVVWALSVRVPERVAGVVGMSVPFMPRNARPPTEAMRFLFGDMFFSILYFQEPGVADENLGRDAAASMRRFLCGVTTRGGADASAMLSARDERGMVERLPEPDGLPDWLTQAELDHYGEVFARTGFTGGLNWYRNFDRNWSINEAWGTRKIEMPAGFIAGKDDPVLVMTPPAIMEGSVPDLRVLEIVDGAGHWVQQEKPAEVNAALLEFASSLQGATDR